MDKLIVQINDDEAMEVYTAEGNFYRSIATLAKEGVPIWTCDNLFLARIKGGPEHTVSTQWSWTAESFNHYPDGSIVVALRDCNPILKNTGKVTDYQINWEKYYLSKKIADELRERAEKDPEKARKSGALLLERKNTEPIPAEHLAEHPLGYFLSPNNAKPYGKLCQRAKIPAIPIYAAEKAKKPFSLALGVNDIILGSRSNLSGYYSLSYSSGRVHGALIVPSKQDAQKVLESLVEKCDGFIRYKGIIYVPKSETLTTK